MEIIRVALRLLPGHIQTANWIKNGNQEKRKLDYTTVISNES